MKKIIFIMTALIAFVAAGNLSAQTVNDVNIKYNEAATLVQAKKYAEAIPVLELVVDMGFDVGQEAAATVDSAQKALPNCYFQYGLMLARQGKLDDALVQLNKAIELGELYGTQPAVRKAKELSAQVYMQKGAAAFNNKNYKAAIPFFAKGYEIDPTFTQNAMYLAESYCEDGDLKKGFAVYDEIIALGQRSNRYQKAAEDANSKKLYYLTVQANDVAKKGNRNESYRLFEEIFKLDANNAYAHMTRVQVANNAEDWANVVRWAPKAAEVQANAADKSEVWFMQGAAYQNQAAAAGDEARSKTLTDNAIAAYRKVTAGNKAALAKDQIEALQNPPKK